MIRLKSFDDDRKNIDILVIPVCSNKEIHGNKEIVQLNKKAKTFSEFSGKKEEEITLYDLPESSSKRIIFIGLGESGELTGETLRAFCGNAIKRCMKNKFSTAAFVAPESKKTGLEAELILKSMMQGACLGNDVFDVYKGKKEIAPVEHIDMVVSPEDVKKFAALAEKTEIICQGTLLARKWINIPANHKQPEKFAKILSKAAEGKNLDVVTLNEKDLKKEKMNALLAVASGSQSPARMVVMKYRHEKAKKHVALIGKGVTFDSGGINLKPSGSIEDMKVDMSGSAATAATIIAIAALELKINVTAVMPLVENMPSGNATRPGDIITSLSGKTVEILNTDAEGRLILIDAITYVQSAYSPDIMIDVATLTGACVVALGEKIAGLFSNDDKLAEIIRAAGEKNNEPCWRMPLPDDYKELLKSDTADIQNISSSRWGGAITAALFLSEFVEMPRWAHIDIAGPASTKKCASYCGSGGTGFGVRLLCDTLEALA